MAIAARMPIAITAYDQKLGGRASRPVINCLHWGNDFERPQALSRESKATGRKANPGEPPRNAPRWRQAHSPHSLIGSTETRDAGLTVKFNAELRRLVYRECPFDEFAVSRRQRLWEGFVEEKL